MSQLSNQFNITNEKGALTLILNNNIIDGLVSSSEVGTLTPGVGLVITDVAGKKPRFELATAKTDNIFGFMPFDIRVSEFVADEAIKIAFNDCVMIMEASGAIAAGAKLEYDPATNKVATHSADSTIIGYSLEKAATDGDLIPVLIKTPFERIDLALLGLSATIAEINKLDTSIETETIDSGVAVDPAKRITNIDNTTSGAGAITLAAPDASMLGLVKIIEMTVDGGDVTMALTNVQGGSAATTCTWANVGETLVLVAGSTKWNVASEGGVVLS